MNYEGQGLTPCPLHATLHTSPTERAYMNPIINDMTEHDALILLNEMTEKYGWAGTMFTRKDVEQIWQNMAPENAEQEMPDEFFDNLANTYHWVRVIPARLNEVGWDLVYEAVAGEF